MNRMLRKFKFEKTTETAEEISFKSPFFIISMSDGPLNIKVSFLWMISMCLPTVCCIRPSNEGFLMNKNYSISFIQLDSDQSTRLPFCYFISRYSCYFGVMIKAQVSMLSTQSRTRERSSSLSRILEDFPLIRSKREACPSAYFQIVAFPRIWARAPPDIW